MKIEIQSQVIGTLKKLFSLKMTDLYGTATTKLLFVADFDGTLTKHDTTNLSFRACRGHWYGTPDEREQIERVRATRAVKYFKEYSHTFEESLKRYGTDQSNPGHQDLVKFSKTLDEYNKESRIQLAHQHTFDDIISNDPHIIKELCRDIEFQEGALDTIRFLRDSTAVAAQEEVVKCKILSVNWFKPVLETSLDSLVASGDIITAATPVLNSNEGEGDAMCDLGLASSSVDKLDWIRRWKSESPPQCTCAFVGDSMTDLLALLEADVGILIGKNQQVLNTVDIFGVDLQPLSQVISSSSVDSAISASNGNNGMRLYYADNWSEILAFVKMFCSTQS